MLQWLLTGVIVIASIIILLKWEKVNKNVEREKVIVVDRKERNRVNKNYIPHCPKCSSSNVKPVKKGFGVGKAVIWGTLLGPIGVASGAIGANKIEIKCMNCGHKYKKHNSK